MKSLIIGLTAALLLPACQNNHIEFTGKVPGLTSGVFLVKEGDNMLFSEDIKTGAFHSIGGIEEPGYYTMDIMDNAHTDRRHNPYEVYLEPGKYTVTADASNLSSYPKIESSSKIQQDLSAYYAILNGKAAHVSHLLDELDAKMQKAKGNKTAIGEQAYNMLYSNLLELQNRKSELSLLAFREFMRERPKSDIAAHLMERLDYESDPAPYYAIFKNMSVAAKNSPEGRELGPKLHALVSVLPGSVAPDIAGLTPDGKKFNSKALDKQIYVIDFWRAGNEVSRLNHQDMTPDKLMAQVDMKKVGFISISLDKTRNWWTTAIHDDHLSWAQYSDLKGDDSANAQNWVVTSIPLYYLVDGNWHIIQRDVSFNRLAFEVNEYLKHPPRSHGNHAMLQYSKNMVGGQMPYSYTAGKLAE